MATPGPQRVRPLVVLAATALAIFAGSATAQVLPWEVTLAEIEAGRLRSFAERLNKQNLLYQYHLGGIQKSDLDVTVAEIDRIIESLERGRPSYSIPDPWTPALRDQVSRVYQVWGPLRRIAVASPYEYLRVSRQFMQAETNRGDPLSIHYFDNLSRELILESEKLQALYDEECVKTGLGICTAARGSGYAAMLMERLAKQAVSLVVGLDVEQNRDGLETTIAAYHEVRKQNDASPFFAEALNPERGPSAVAAGQLLVSLRQDWDALQVEVTMLAAGDEENFDLQRLLEVQRQLVAKVERLTAALIRFASVTYGS